MNIYLWDQNKLFFLLEMLCIVSVLVAEKGALDPETLNERHNYK